MGNIQRASRFISAALYLLWRTAATLGIVLAVALCLFQDHAEAVTYCIDMGGSGWDCQEVPGWKRIVTGTSDVSNANLLGACSTINWPLSDPGTTYVEYTDTTCDGRLLRNWFYYVCPGGPVPAVGAQVAGGTEVPYNGADEDCNPATPDDDLDGDGYPKALDCNDNDNKVYPGAKEICDGKDNNCNGVVDEECEGGDKPKGALGAPEDNGGPKVCR